MEDEKAYRQKVAEVFREIEKAFDQVDPDVAEAELSQGALTIFTGKSRTILSPQPSVRQIWLAAAHLGFAVHFNFDTKSGRWMDDKGQGYELFSYVQDCIRKACGYELRFASKP